MDDRLINVAHSSASAKFEAMLLEKGGLGNGPNEEKAVTTFEILDRIIPHLGIFSQIVKLCRNEIFDAVYNSELTGSADHPKDGSQFIQHLPFFLLVKRIKDFSEESETTLKQEITDTQNQLSEEKAICLDLNLKIKHLNDSSFLASGAIVRLETELEAAENQIKNLKLNLERMKRSKDESESGLNREITQLKLELESAAKEMSYLQTFKDGYDKLQTAVQNWNGTDIEPKQNKRRETVANQKSTLLSDIKICLQLEGQILNIQNAIFEEYDDFVEKSTIVEFEFLPKLASTQTKEEEEEDSLLDNHLMTSMQEKFRKNVKDVDNELKLLRQHKQQLQQQLQEMEAAQLIEMKQMESNVDVDVVDNNHDLEMTNLPSINPFLPHEHILNKYAAMLYASDNSAKSFYEFKDAMFCSSCGDKTVLCPHKFLNEEHIFTLTPGVTHIKLTRPKVKINSDRLLQERQIVEEMGGSQGNDLATWSQSVLTPTSDSIADADSAIERTTSAAEIYFIRSTELLWEDYRQRTNLERTNPRQLTLDRTLSMIYKFCEGLLNSDNNCPDEDEDHLTILDHLYIFFEDRYLEPSNGLLAAYDFIGSAIEHQSSSKFVWLFVQVLTGNLDGAALRYVLLVKELANSVHWTIVDDFKTFAKIVYPFITEDDVEMLHIDYVSCSKNKISKELVTDYIIHTIMKYREPRFLEMESLLVSQLGKDSSVMTETEFVRASNDSVLTTTHDKLQRHLFKETLSCVNQLDGPSQGQGLPLIRLAQIGSYLNLRSSVYHLNRRIKAWQ